jgi:hypothetical protein
MPLSVLSLHLCYKYSTNHHLAQLGQDHFQPDYVHHHQEKKSTVLLSYHLKLHNQLFSVTEQAILGESCQLNLVVDFCHHFCYQFESSLEKEMRK